MDTRDRLVLVAATSLTDLLDLVDRALPALDEALRAALAGASAEMRVRAVLEPA